MTTTEIIAWQAANSFWCERMKAQISETACQQNIRQAKLYQETCQRKQSWMYGKISPDAYHICSRCDKSGITYEPDARLARASRHEPGNSIDYWETWGGR